jgi:hypothetical protein
MRIIPSVGEQYIPRYALSSARGSGGNHDKIVSPVSLDVICREPMAVMCNNTEDAGIIKASSIGGSSATEDISSACDKSLADKARLIVL